MAEGKQNATLAFAGGAAVAAALLAWRTRSAQAANGNVVLDKATMDLLAAIAAACGDIDLSMAKLDDILAVLTAGAGGGGGSVPGQGWPANRPGIRCATMPLAAAATGYQLPVQPVPSGFTVLVKGYPTNAGLIFVGEDLSYVTNIPAGGAGGSVWPLLPNEGIGFQVDDVSRIWVAAATAGDMVSWAVER
jgi:hypothetical protein